MKTSDNWQLPQSKRVQIGHFGCFPPPPGGLWEEGGWSPSKMGSTKNFHICFLWILWSVWILSKSVLTPSSFSSQTPPGDIRQKWGQPRIFRFASYELYEVFGYCLDQFYPHLTPHPPGEGGAISVKNEVNQEFSDLLPLTSIKCLDIVLRVSGTP